MNWSDNEIRFYGGFMAVLGLLLGLSVGHFIWDVI